MWWVLVLEAGVALFLLIFIVWWTMFSGQPSDRSAPENKPQPPKDEAGGTPG